MNSRDEEADSGGIAGSDWNLDRIVAELRASRAGSRAGGKREEAAPLPSRKAVARIIDGLFAPRRFRCPSRLAVAMAGAEAPGISCSVTDGVEVGLLMAEIMQDPSCRVNGCQPGQSS